MLRLVSHMDTSCREEGGREYQSSSLQRFTFARDCLELPSWGKEGVRFKSVTVPFLLNYTNYHNWIPRQEEFVCSVAVAVATAPVPVYDDEAGDDELHVGAEGGVAVDGAHNVQEGQNVSGGNIPCWKSRK